MIKTKHPHNTPQQKATNPSKTYIFEVPRDVEPPQGVEQELLGELGGGHVQHLSVALAVKEECVCKKVGERDGVGGREERG